MTFKTQTTRVAFAVLAVCSMLTACGGGGGSDSPDTGTTNPTNPPVATVPAGSTQTTPTYAADTAKARIFGALNSYRTQCGFPAYQQNTVLDSAAQAHADYMVSNGVVSDSETAGAAGFTGATAQDRAQSKGWPSSLGAGTVNAGMWTTSTLTQAQYGQGLLDAWTVGVYHQVVIASNATLAGVGTGQRDLSGFPEFKGGIVYAYGTASPANVTTSGNVLTFPCEGSTGVPYQGSAESPTPPSTSGAWGTPVTVVGNPSDTVVLSAATVTAVTAGTVLPVKILTADTDPNRLVQRWQAVAYPLSPLTANTAYAVTLTGTVNGVAFSRSFTFTTGMNGG